MAETNNNENTIIPGSDVWNAINTDIIGYTSDLFNTINEFRLDFAKDKWLDVVNDTSKNQAAEMILDAKLNDVQKQLNHFFSTGLGNQLFKDADGSIAASWMNDKLSESITELQNKKLDYWLENNTRSF